MANIIVHVYQSVEVTEEGTPTFHVTVPAVGAGGHIVGDMAEWLEDVKGDVQYLAYEAASCVAGAGLRVQLGEFGGDIAEMMGFRPVYPLLFNPETKAEYDAALVAGEVRVLEVDVLQEYGITVESDPERYDEFHGWLSAATEAFEKFDALSDAEKAEVFNH